MSAGVFSKGLPAILLTGLLCVCSGACLAGKSLFTANALIMESPRQSLTDIEVIDCCSDHLLFQRESEALKVFKEDIFGFQGGDADVISLSPRYDAPCLRMRYMAKGSSASSENSLLTVIYLYFSSRADVEKALQSLSWAVFNRENRLGNESTLAVVRNQADLFQGSDIWETLEPLLADTGLKTEKFEVSPENSAAAIGWQLYRSDRNFCGVLVAGGDPILNTIVNVFGSGMLPNGQFSRCCKNPDWPVIVIPTDKNNSIASSLGLESPPMALLLAIRALKEPGRKRRALSLLKYKTQYQGAPSPQVITHEGFCLSGIRLGSRHQVEQNAGSIVEIVERIRQDEHLFNVRSCPLSGDFEAYAADSGPISRVKDVRDLAELPFDGKGDFGFLLITNVPNFSCSEIVSPGLEPECREMSVVFVERDVLNGLRGFDYRLALTERWKRSALQKKMWIIGKRSEVALRALAGDQQFYIDGGWLNDFAKIVTVKSSDHKLMLLIPLRRYDSS